MRENLFDRDESLSVAIMALIERLAKTLVETRCHEGHSTEHFASSLTSPLLPCCTSPFSCYFACFKVSSLLSAWCHRRVCWFVHATVNLFRGSRSYLCMVNVIRKKRRNKGNPESYVKFGTISTHSRRLLWGTHGARP